MDRSLPLYPIPSLASLYCLFVFLIQHLLCGYTCPRFLCHGVIQSVTFALKKYYLFISLYLVFFTYLLIKVYYKKDKFLGEGSIGGV